MTTVAYAMYIGRKYAHIERVYEKYEGQENLRRIALCKRVVPVRVMRQYVTGEYRFYPTAREVYDHSKIKSYVCPRCKAVMDNQEEGTI